MAFNVPIDNYRMFKESEVCIKGKRLVKEYLAKQHRSLAFEKHFHGDDCAIIIDKCCGAILLENKFKNSTNY